MTSHAISQIRNFRAAGAGVPRSLETEAVIEMITEGWDFNSVRATAEHGVCSDDRAAIREIIEDEGLSISPDEAEAALVEWCRAGVADADPETGKP